MVHRSKPYDKTRKFKGWDVEDLAKKIIFGEICAIIHCIKQSVDIKIGLPLVIWDTQKDD